MRKKAHISLAKYLMGSVGVEELSRHSRSFIFGSILPDCVPSFLTRKHNIEETFEILREELHKITDEYNMKKGMGMYYCRHLGIITHYIADYFTFPHNGIFDGNLKEHCSYEKEQKFSIRAYLTSGEARLTREKNGTFANVSEICDFIKKMHQEYLAAVSHAVRLDCEYIVELTHRVVDALLQIFEKMQECFESKRWELVHE